MEGDLSRYDEYVRESILANNSFGITQVHQLETIRSTYFDRNGYEVVQELIRKMDIEKLGQLPENRISVSGYLDVISFKDQSGRSFLVTIYDNVRLEQDPQVIEIFSTI